MEKADELERAHGVMGKGAFIELEKSLGATYNPRGLLACLPLRPFISPSKALTYDLQHTLFQQGIVSFEISNVLEAMRQKVGVRYAVVRLFLLAEWTFPTHRKRDGMQLFRLFNDDREEANRKSGTFKASSSETMFVYVLLRRFIEQHIATLDRNPHPLQAEIQSFRSMCDVADVVRQTRLLLDMREVVSSDIFQSTVSKHRRDYNAAYPGDSKPKHHYTYHLCNWGLDCFAPERHHRASKEAAADLFNTPSLEDSLLCRMILRQQHQLEKPGALSDALLPPILSDEHMARTLGVESVCFAASMVCTTAPVSCGDVVKVGNAIGVVEGCMAMEDELLVLLMELRLIAKEYNGAWRMCLVRNSILRVLTTNVRISHACCWTLIGDNDDEFIVLW